MDTRDHHSKHEDRRPGRDGGENGAPENPGVGRREALLPKFSLDRRVTVLVLLATILVMGTIATLGLPLELIPRGFDLPMLRVDARWSQAPAREVLDKVALPLEEELATVPGLENQFTFATAGFSRVRLMFKQGTDMDVAYREVRDRMERAKARMPDDVDRVLLRKADDAEVPVFAFGITVDPGLTDAYNLIQNEIVMPIQRIDGVATIDVQGLVEKEVLIELDRERTEAAGLNIFELGLDLSSDNFTLASGHVEASGKKLLLRSVARYPDLEALKDRRMSRDVRLGDIAEIRYAEPEKRFYARANSKPAFFAVVFKEGEANALEVSDAIAAAIETMEANPRLTLVELQVFLNQGKIILESLGILLDSGRIGALFAACVLFFFLRRFRMTLIIALSIPLSIFIGLTAMYFAGETLNLITLLGLMISVGLLVDNSVVVAENIYRLHQAGLDRRRACIRGAGEISLAVVMATLTTIIVFLPVSLVEGQGQFFMLRLAIPITVSLVASLLVALVFVPLSVYLTLPSSASTDGVHHRIGERARTLLRNLYERTFGHLNRGYSRMLAFFLRRRMDLVMAVTAVVALTAVGPFEHVKTSAIQEDERGGFDIDVVLPPTTTLEEAAAHFRRVEKVLEAKQEEWDLQTYLIVHRNSFGEIQGWFNIPRNNDITPRELTKELVDLIPERAGAKLYTGLEGDDEDNKKALKVYTLTGEDPDQLEAVAEILEERFKAVDGVLGIRRSGDEPAEEMAVRVERDRAQRLSVNPEAVAGVVRNSLGGRALPKFYRDGREIPVRVRYREEDRENLAQLLDFRVPTQTGQAVPLGSIVGTQRLEAAGRIFRTNKQVSRTITLELQEGREKSTRDRLEAVVAAYDLPEGMRFGNPRRGMGQADEVQAMVFAMLLSVMFIYLLMGFLFESFILPLSIVTTIPLAILGVYWGHFLTDIDLDALGMVGIVLLIGVVVNNGIVLVDYVNRLRSEGERRQRAVLLAADRRFRPIMMTALTTICGMFPLLLGGQTSIGLSYESFAITLIGGMTVATLLTLLVVPVTYTLFDDLRLAFDKAVAGAMTTPPADPDRADSSELPAPT
ncbi:MAG: efflux RND transporter permease subunit [Acidobacteriota bacterium]